MRVLEQIGRIRVGAFDRVPQCRSAAVPQCRSAAVARYAFWPMKVSALLRLIESDGWQLARTRGSHRQYKHPTRPGLVTVAGEAERRLAPEDASAQAALGSILKQAGLIIHCITQLAGQCQQ